jgi:uncharacterized protein YciI
MTRYFAVIRGPGPQWVPNRPRREQEGWAAHAEFMNGLAETGFVVLGGPIDDTRALLIVDAAGEHEIAQCLVADPWTEMEILSTICVQPWEILLDRSAETQPK